MSTELSEISQKKHKSKKSHKKDKDPDRVSKKRQRDEPSADSPIPDLIPDSQPTPKKQKKEKRHDRHGKSISKVNAATTTSTIPPQHFSDDLLVSQTPFLQQTTSLYLPLSPCAFNYPLEGACAEHLSPLLLTYSSVLQGVVLAYSDARLTSEVTSESSKLEDQSQGRALGTGSNSKRKDKDGFAGSKTVATTNGAPKIAASSSSSTNDPILLESKNEYGTAFVWLTADFLLFRPRRGSYLTGYVTMQNESMLGLLCYNYFHAGIERGKLPSDWKWIEPDADGELMLASNGGGGDDDEAAAQRDWTGHFVDGAGKRVEGKLVFRVLDFGATAASTDEGAGSVSIEGTLLPEDA